MHRNGQLALRSREEDDAAFVQKLKVRALKDIDSAVERTQRGLCDEGEMAFCGK